MRCSVCGEKMSGLHVCSGAVPSPLTQASESEIFLESSNSGFDVLHYFRLACRILWLDSDAIESASRDPGALRHGVLFLAFGVLLGAAFGDMAQAGWKMPSLPLMWWVERAEEFVLVVPVFLVYYGLLHFVMRRLFSGRGTYWWLIRPLMLASILTWLDGLPIISLAANLWGAVVFIVVCREVEDIERWEVIASSVIALLPFLALFFLVVGKVPS